MARADIEELGRRAKSAARELATAGGAAKDGALRVAAELLEERCGEILEHNRTDLDRARRDGATDVGVDRLRLTPERVATMADSLRQVAELADPVGEVVEGWVRPNGLRVERIRVPLGVVGVIYENRPNVTSDAAGLSLKAGNATMLRGSSSAADSNASIVGCLRDALAKVGLPEDAVVNVADTSREAAVQFMQLDGMIDCLVPRGSHSLIATVREHATVPVVIDGDGNCHVYVDAAAELDMALAIVENAKTQRPGVCNAAESLLVHESVAAEFLPRAERALSGVELRGDEASRAILPTIVAATEEDYATEFLGPVLSVAVVADLDAAIDHIARYGSGHSEAIVTTDLRAAERFCREVDAAAIVVNASTRFVDGGSWGSGPRSGSRPRSSTPAVPWGCASSRA